MNVFNRCFEDIRRCQERLERYMVTIDRNSAEYKRMKTMLDGLHVAREAIPVEFRVGRYILEQRRRKAQAEDEDTR